MTHSYSLRSSKMIIPRENHADGDGAGQGAGNNEVSNVKVDANKEQTDKAEDKNEYTPQNAGDNGRKTPSFTDYLSKDDNYAHAMQEMGTLRGELGAQKTEISRLSGQLHKLILLMENQAKDKSGATANQKEYEFPTELSNQSGNPLRDEGANAKCTGTIPKNTRQMHTGGNAVNSAAVDAGVSSGVGSHSGGREVNATGRNGSNINDLNPPVQFSLSRADNREINFAFTKWDPEWWFQNLESQMLYKHITDDQAKYWVVMNNLGEEKRTIGDAFRGVVEGRKYESLKEIVLKKFTKTRQQKLHELFSELRAEGRKPSELFYHMGQLAQGEIKEGAIYTWWLGKLPYNVQAILPAMYNAEKIITTLNEADRLHELLKRQGDPVFEVSESPKHENALTARLEAIEKSLKERNERAKTRSRSRSRTRDGPSKSEYCYYHEKFKKKAYRCKGNCAWKGQLAERPKPKDNSEKKKSKEQSEDEKN